MLLLLLFLLLLSPLVLMPGVMCMSASDDVGSRIRIARELDGDLDVLVQHTSTGQKMSYSLRLDVDNTVRQLVFPADLPGYIGSGSKLTVRIDEASTAAYTAGDGSTLVVSDFDIRELGPGKDFPTGDATVDLYSITWVLNLCTRPNDVTPAAVRAKWFKAQAPAQAQTLEGYYNMCSYGKVRFTSANNVVVGPIDVPCSGFMTGNFAYSSTTCSNVDVYAWAEYAQNYTTSVLGISLSPFTRRILILPSSTPCQWAGLGSIGCGSYCYTWLMNPYALNLDTAFHELGHNLGLQHSTTPGSEYGDNSCAMGGAAGVRCFNAPQLWRLGWAATAQTYDMASNFAPGVWHGHTIAADAVSSSSMIRVVTPTSAFFVSYRQPIGFDSGLVAPYRYRVFVHMFRGAVGVLTGDKPELQTLNGLTINTTYTDTVGGWRVLVTSITKATNSSCVTLCRYSQTVETDCHNGLDDDCNGLVDALDPACSHVPVAPANGSSQIGRAHV